jgi:hypothetical protein
MSKYVDQYQVADGWKNTEDISFQVQAQLFFGLPGDTQEVPIQFDQPPLRLYQSVPQATHAFLVMRLLHIDVVRPLAHFIPTWQWNQAADATFTAAASTTGGTATVTYRTGPAPSTDNTLANALPLALRRIALGTLPSGVTITKVECKPGWATNYDNLHIASPISGNIDLAQYYDGQWGLINNFMTIETDTTINVRFTYNNTNGSPTSVPYQLYGNQRGFQWAQWKIEYQPPQGGVYVITEFDDHDTPSRTIVLDKLIPLQITDSGITDFGKFIWTANNQIPFTGLSSSYNLMLTATVAYLVPD